MANETRLGEITRIEGLSARRRLPRLGKIRLGERRVNKSGREYPVALPYFRFDDEVRAAYPEIARVYGAAANGTLEPKELDVILPHEEQAVMFPQACKLYGRGRGLKCKGDGKRALRSKCVACGKVECGCESDRVWEEQPCPCDLLKEGKCKYTGSLMVILPRVSWAGVFQIDTSSINSIVDVNSGIEFVRSLCGHVVLVPLKLRLVARQAHAGGSVKTIHTLQLGFDGDLATIRRLRSGGDAPALRIEAPHDDGDDLPAVQDHDPDEPHVEYDPGEGPDISPAEPPPDGPADESAGTLNELERQGELPLEDEVVNSSTKAEAATRKKEIEKRDHQAAEIADWVKRGDITEACLRLYCRQCGVAGDDWQATSPKAMAMLHAKCSGYVQCGDLRAAATGPAHGAAVRAGSRSR